MDKYFHFFYDFSDIMRVRFPLLYMIELQNSLQQQVEERKKKRPKKKRSPVNISGKLDSNQRPQRPERRALPTALLPVKKLYLISRWKRPQHPEPIV